MAICYAGEVEEIFTTMDIPAVVAQWWSGLIAAKQLSTRYFQLLDSKGYTACRYCALGLGCTMDRQQEDAPWGGLPKPTVIVGGQIPSCECDAAQKITEIWAREYGAAHYHLEETYPTRDYGRWWERIRDHWDEVIEPHRIDLRVEELKGLIRFLETSTGRAFSLTRFNEVMQLVNEQNEYLNKVHDLIATAERCPVSAAEQLSIYRIQWHRGTKEALDLARRFYEEVRSRVDRSEAAFANERLRLMWIGVGMWHNTAFYQYFEDKYGAVFTSTLYLAVAADGYQRSLKQDPLRALASRSVFLGLGGPDWCVKEAKLNRIDGVVQLVNKSCRESLNTPLTRLALEQAGIPVLPLYTDNVDPREWDDKHIRSLVERFIEDRLLAR